MDERKIYREKYGKRIAEALSKNCKCCLIDSEDLALVQRFVSVDSSFEIQKDNIGSWLFWRG